MAWQCDLPNFEVTAPRPVSAAFRALGIADFHGAILHVAALPYGRVRDGGACTAVLNEARGTCSTKHALLAALATENGHHEVHLTLGIYAMDEANSPGVGAVLERAGLARIPEAHCYLTLGGRRFDFTRDGDEDASTPTDVFLYEEDIRPDQIGAHKVGVHQDFLRSWARRNHRNWNAVWDIREACIAALSAAADRADDVLGQ